jgi:hypothetical protein
VDIGQLLSRLVEWNGVTGNYILVGAAAALAEYAYGFLLSRSAVAEQRARGYSTMQDALASFLVLFLFFFAVNGAVAAVHEVADSVAHLSSFPEPSQAINILAQARDRFVRWLIQVANLEKDLTGAVLTAPLVATVAASSTLGRFALQTLLTVVVFLEALLRALVEQGAAKVMVAAGSLCILTPRLRRLGPYLIFSAVALTLVGCGTAYAVSPLLSGEDELRFRYEGFAGLPNPIELITKAIDFNKTINDLVHDGYVSSRAAAWVSLGLGAAAAVTAAASAAAGGLADSLASRLRL